MAAVMLGLHDYTPLYWGPVEEEKDNWNIVNCVRVEGVVQQVLFITDLGS